MAAPRSTRQLLGELDALMDQMLSLPVEEGASRTATAESPPLARTEPDPAPLAPSRPPLHPLAVSMTLLDLPKEPPVDEFAPSEPSDTRARMDPAETSPSARQLIDTLPNVEIAEESAAPIVKESFWVGEADLVPDPPPRPVPTRGPRKLKPAASRPRDVAPAPIVPLPSRALSRTYGLALRFHRLFARRTYGLGFLGRLVRSDAFVTILGVLGILMLLVAAGWLAKDLLRWT